MQGGQHDKECWRNGKSYSVGGRRVFGAGSIISRPSHLGHGHIECGWDRRLIHWNGGVLSGMDSLWP